MTSRSLPLVALVIGVVIAGVNVRLVGGTWADVRYHAEVAPPRLAAADAVQSGALPAWWDGTGLGVPLAGEPSHGAMYPPTWLAASPGTLDWLYVLHLAWAALGVALWARRRGASDPAAVAAGLLVATTGILAATAMRGALPAVAHLPWIGWAATWLVDVPERRTTAAIALGGFLGLVGLAGELAVLFDGLVLALAISARRETRGYVAVAVAGGLAIAAAQWLPAIHVLAGDHAGAQVGGLPLARLVELVVPGSFGSLDPDRGVAAIAGDAAWAPSVFVGAPLLALAAVRTPVRRELVAIGAYVVLALVAGRGGWPHWLGAPELHVAVLACVLGANAAAGIDALLAGERRARLALGAGAGCTAIALVALAVLRARQPDAADALRRALADGGIGVVCMAGALAVGKRARPVVLALIVLPSLGALPSTAPVIDRDVLAPGDWTEQVIALHLPRPLRLYRPMYMTDVRPTDRPEVVVGKSPSARREATEPLDEALATLTGTSAARWGLSAMRSEDPARLAVVDRAFYASAREGGALLDRFGVALAILPTTVVEAMKQRPLGKPRGRWALVALPVAPSAAVMRGWMRAVDPDNALALLFPAGGGTGVGRGTTVLRGRGESHLDARDPLPCAIDRWVPGEIDLACTADVSGYAVVSSAAEPGWTVTVDDADADWDVADVMRRGVATEPGSHRVQWRYAAPGLRAGMLVAGIAIALFIALAISRRKA